MPEMQHLARGLLFHIALVLIPVVLIAAYMLNNAAPRWTVAPPLYHLYVSIEEHSDNPPPFTIEFQDALPGIRAVVRRRANDNTGIQRLYLFDAEIGLAREIAVPIPDTVLQTAANNSGGADPLWQRLIVPTPINTNTSSPDGWLLLSEAPNGNVLSSLLGLDDSDRGRITIEKEGRRASATVPTPAPQPRLVGWALPPPS